MSTITFKQRQDAIYAWINSIANPVTTDFEITLANQNFPIQKTSSKGVITFQITSVSRVAEDYISSPDATGLSEATGNREFIVEINVYSTKRLSDLSNLRVFDTIEALQNSLRNPVVLDTLRASNIVFVDDINIQDLSALDKTEFEQRANYEVTFRFGLDAGNVIQTGLIDTVNIEGEYTTPDGNSINESIQITSP